MRHLSIDIETKSSVDIGKAGLYRYAQSDDFEILLFAYRYDNEEVQIIDLAQGETIPETIAEDLKNPRIVKHAYNAAFEWYCLNHAGYKTPLAQWRCTMIHGLYCGYTAGLDATGKAIGLPQDKRKLATGKALIRYFCVPCKPTKSNGNRSWNLPKHAPEKWELFKEYCRQDVVTESAILARLDAFPVPDEEERLWQMDIRMNAFGVKVDSELIRGALQVNEQSTILLEAEAKEITGLDNPNSSTQLLDWIHIEYDSYCNEFELGRKRIFVRPEMLTNADGTPAFDPDDSVFYALPEDDANGEGLLKEIDMSLRAEQHSKAINDDLNYLSLKCGFGTDRYQFGATGAKTATEIISENSDMYRMIKKHEILLEDALRQLIQIIIRLGMILGNTLNPECEITIDFDDSIIEDKETERSRDRQDVSMGVMSLAEYRAKWYGESEEDAAKNLPEQNQVME